MTGCQHAVVEARTVQGKVGIYCKECSSPIGRYSKYKNQRTNGYASKKEANTSANLHVLQDAGLISDLEEQVRFGLIPEDDLGPSLAYIADFTFVDRGAGYGLLNSLVVMDAKGLRTPVYKLKRRLMYHFHGIVIKEV